ncbi:MAG TPA: hypothetical protein PLK90_00990 [Clostridiales bacterium]|nr:hypothetical protein [Clostridiales bacterium]HQP68952.1 hypothetical protein [Clostridiales bacterium]
MNRKYWFVGFIILINFLNAGSGFYFLRTEMPAKEIASAQTSYLFSQSAENSQINPGSAYGNEIFTAGVSYRTLFDDAEAGIFSVSYRDGNRQYGLIVSSLNISGLEGRDIPSESPLYEFGSNNIIVNGNFAFESGYGFKLGISAKYLFEKIEYEDSYGYAFSAGVFRENNFIEGLNLGLAVNNIGKMNELNTESSKLPSDAVFGIGYIYRTTFNIDLKAGNSVRFLFEDLDMENYIGLEIAYLDRFFFRSGLRAMNEGMPFSAGIGLVVDKFTFDYAYTPFSDVEGDDSHCISLKYCLK